MAVCYLLHITTKVAVVRIYFREQALILPLTSQWSACQQPLAIALAKMEALHFFDFRIIYFHIATIT
jgi:hypothetical protein